MTTTTTIFLLLLIPVLGEGMPVTKINKPHDDKKEPWNFGDDDGDKYNDNFEDKVPLTAKHLSTTDTQEQLTDISRKVEKVLDKYPGLELETFYSEKDDKIILKAKVSLQDHVGRTNIFDDDDDDFTDYVEVINDSLVEADNDDDDYDDDDDASDVENSYFTGDDNDNDDHYVEEDEKEED